MSGRERLTLAAAFAVALGAAAVVPLYAELHWLLRALGGIVAVALAGLAVRRGNVPAILHPIATAAALLEYVCLTFARTTLGLGLLPTGDTVHALNNLLQAGLTDIERLSPPVPSNTGLTLIAVLGVGAVAVVVDLIAVAFGRAAVAGLPLLVLFAVPAAILPGGLGWIPFTFGAAGWLSLLLVEGGDRVSRWGTPLRAAAPDRGARYDDTSLGRVGRRIGAAALGVAVVVPAFVPGLDTRLLGGSGGGDGTGDGSRTTTTYNPITRLRDDLRLPKEREILVYATDADRPDYLRMTTLDRFNDAGWSSSKLSGSPKTDGVSGTLPAPVGLLPRLSERLKVTIRISQLDAQWLPVPAVPSRVQVEGPWLYDARSETVFGIRTGTKKLRKSYSVTSLRPIPVRATLDGGPDFGPPEDIRQYALDPGEEITPRVRALTERVLKGKVTPYAKVAAIQAFFTKPSSGFRYSLSSQVPGIDSPSALEDFLTGRQGFCEQYASAMAAMIRIAQVPARVAVGFTPGLPQPDGTYRVTTKDAHAWPEAWFAGAGWVRFEPTPRGDGQTTIPAYAVPADPTANGGGGPQGGAATPESGPDATGDVRNPQRDRLDRIDNAPLAVPDDSAVPVGRRHATSLGLLGVTALVLGLLLPRGLHVVRRRRRWRAGGADAGWQQVRDDAVDLGHVWRPADSPRAAAAALAQRHAFDAPARESLGRLAAAAERARYAREAGRVEPGLQADAATVRSALRAAAGRTTRWRAVLLPTSTLRWAASGLGTFIADLLDHVDEAWSALRRLPARGA